MPCSKSLKFDLSSDTRYKFGRGAFALGFSSRDVGQNKYPVRTNER
jgi:hypothetical protein